MSAASQEGGDAASRGLSGLKLPGWMYMVGSKCHWRTKGGGGGGSSDVGFSKGSRRISKSSSEPVRGVFRRGALLVGDTGG